MTRGYFSYFVVKQKCVPWFIIAQWRRFLEIRKTLQNKWRAIVNFIRVQRFIQTIDLEKTYECYLDISDNLELGNREHPKHLFKDSIQVQFLKEFKDKACVTDDEIKESEYYGEKWECLQNYGSYQKKNDATGLKKYCRDYLDLYQRFKNKTRRHNYFYFISSSVDHFKYGYPMVYKISDSDNYMIWDGHHRLACQYLLGERFVKAKIIGAIKNRP